MRIKILNFSASQKGFSLIELILTVALASLLLPALLTGFAASRNGRAQLEQRLKAIAFAREAEEAVRVVRERDWTTFAVNGTYYPRISGATWVLETGAEPRTDGFSRTVTISDVYRDADGYIASSGTPDPSTKKAVINVSWTTPLAASVSTTEFLTRFGNTALSESGTIEPPAGGFGNWCEPVGPSVTNVNLERQGHPTSIRSFETTDGTGNRVLAGTGASADGPAFSNIKIMGNNPPAATMLGNYNGPPQIKVNGLIGDSNYAYLATDNRGVAILDLTTTPYEVIGSFNPSGMKKVNDVYVVGNTGYAVTEDKFYIFNISSDRKTTSQIGVPLALANGIKVVVDSGSQYAYVPNPDVNGELKIVDIHTHPTNLSQSDVRSVNVDAGVGRDVFINAGANRAYLATAASSSKPEFFIINIEDKANPVVLTSGGTYDSEGMDPYGTAIVSGERAIIVGIGGHEYQVFSIANDTVSFCPNHSNNNDFIDIDSGVYAISSLLQSDFHAYSYIATGDAGAELKIIEGGNGGGGSGTGIFESSTFDAGHNVAFNYFSATSDPNLSYKIAIKQAAGGTCPAFSDSDFISISNGPIALPGIGYSNPGQCMRYRVINLGSSAISYFVTINYSQ